MTREDNQTDRYRYDATSQLTEASYGVDRTETFIYDPLGNRIEHTDTTPNQPTKTEHYETNNLNQYTRITSSSPPVSSSLLTYDINGNLTDDGVQHYRYDAQNRLIETESAIIRAEFAYDARNRCILRKYYKSDENGGWILNGINSILLIYDIEWSLLMKQNITNKQIALSVRGEQVDEFLIDIKNSKLCYPFVDALGNTIAIADGQNEKMMIAKYNAFGIHGIGMSIHRDFYTSREWLHAFELSDHRNRYYNNTLGRWLSNDPIRFKALDINLYRYVKNSPNNYTDKTGLETDCTSAYDAIYGAIPALIPLTGQPGYMGAAAALIDSPDTLMMALAGYESMYNANAVNQNGSTGKGLYQILDVAKQTIEVALWRGRCSRNDPFADPNFSGDWRFDPPTATTGAFLYLMESIAYANYDIEAGLNRYGDGSSQYGSKILEIQSYLESQLGNADDPHGYLENNCDALKNEISRIRSSR
jgi:RHS repeat-associated protein